VSWHGSDRQPFPVSDEAVLGQLSRRGIQHRDRGPGRGEDGGLLAAAGCQAKDLKSRQFGEPVGGYGLGGREADRPVAAAGGGADLRADGNRPAVALLDLAVPGAAVISDDIHHDLQPGITSSSEAKVSDRRAALIAQAPSFAAERQRSAAEAAGRDGTS